MEQKLVSVIMPAYNCEKFIKQSIDSVLHQTYPNFELIICDNHSTDHTYQIISQYVNHEKIKILSCETKGVSHARNKCLEHATGQYIAFLDSDDLWYEEKLEKQISFMEKNNIQFCYSLYDYIDEQSEKIKKKPRKIRSECTYHSLLVDNYIGLLTVVMKKETLSDLTFPDVKHEDYVLWLQLVKKNIKTAGLNEILASYRVSPLSLSGNKRIAARWRYDVYRKTEGLNAFKSVFYFMLYALHGIFRQL
ncbi:MAG: glycosyltransferase family 2 protein [Clostridia bacterium]|nr:glycosyltransferase family 2 protein [Clostridia bacterium]